MSGHNLKVGDELAVQGRYAGVFVYRIERFTKSGRIICGPYELNPNLSIRGADTWGPFRMEVVTDEIREKVAIQNLGDQSQKWHQTDKSKVPKEHRQRVWEAINAALTAMKESGQ
jgi:hypothetical protein